MGEGMKFEVLDDKYLYFTGNIKVFGDLTSIDENKISLFLKEVFLSINDIYSVELFGYYKVDIYIDEKIGAFVEIEKLDDFVSYSKKIDTKVSISVCEFYLKTNDLSIIYKYKPIYFSDNNYYISTKSVDSIFELLDFCDVEYKNLDLGKFVSI